MADRFQAASFPLGSFHVVVRVRPENERERAGASYTNVIRVLDKQTLVFDPKPAEITSYVPGDHRYRNTRFVFDSIFAPGSTNRDVYEDTARHLIDPILEGYNCTMFAYGATGAGKTHTMGGMDSSGGSVMSFTISELFSRLSDLSEGPLPDGKGPRTVQLFVSYIEIYNENIRDLLSPTPGQSLPLREDPERGPVVVGAVRAEPHSEAEVMTLLDRGASARVQFATGENAHSSRSHGIFQIMVQQRDDATGQVTSGKLSLVDLAGSERAKRTENSGMRFKEGANINKSLLALGNCINALCRASAARNTLHSNASTATFVPYRNSKLTRLLKDSLGGASKTVMLSAVSPSSYAYDDTLATLTYAQRAKQIKVSAKKNVSPAYLSLAEYARLVDQLRAENDSLKRELQVASAQAARPGPTIRLSSAPAGGAAQGPDTTLLLQLKQRLKELVLAIAEETRTLYSTQCKRKQLQIDLRRYQTHEKIVLSAMESGIQLDAGISEERNTLQYKENLVNQMRVALQIEERAILRIQTLKQNLITLRSAISSLPDRILSDSLFDLLAASSYQAKCIVAQCLAELRLDLLAKVNSELARHKQTFEANCLPAVQELYGLAAIADGPASQAALKQFNEGRFSLDLLVDNYFWFDEEGTGRTGRVQAEEHPAHDAPTNSLMARFAARSTAPGRALPVAGEMTHSQLLNGPGPTPSVARSVVQTAGPSSQGPLTTSGVTALAAKAAPLTGTLGLDTIINAPLEGSAAIPQPQARDSPSVPAGGSSGRVSNSSRLLASRAREQERRSALEAWRARKREAGAAGLQAQQPETQEPPIPPALLTTLARQSMGRSQHRLSGSPRRREKGPDPQGFKKPRPRYSTELSKLERQLHLTTPRDRRRHGR